MTTAVHTAPAPPAPLPPEPWWSRLLRGLGWLLIAAGVVVALFIVYLLWWTDLETAQAQDDLQQSFGALVPGEDDAAGDTDTSLDLRDLANIPVESTPLPPADDPSDDPSDAAGPDGADSGTDADAVDAQGRPLVVPTDPGDAYALLWFQRGDEFIVTDGPVAAVEGVTLDHLRRGPGHYPEAEAPGMAGNTAFAGHRTTYGRPFHNLDLLQDGDEIHVLDNAGRHWVYDFLEVEIVAPTDVWVVEDDAVPGVSHLLTFTSCHPKFSARQRIVAFAELRDAPPVAPENQAEDAPTDAPADAPEGTELPGEDSTAAPSVTAPRRPGVA